MFKLIGKLIKYTIYGSISVVVLLLGIIAMIPEDERVTSANIPTKEVVEVVEEEVVEEVKKDLIVFPWADELEEKKAKREEEKRIAEQKKIEEELAKEKLLAEQKAEEKRKGFHCLSSWDGSHRAVANWTKKQLREPKSFKHINTLVWPVDTQGNHQLVMQYKAKNGFGGMTSGVVKAFYSNSDCGATIKSID